MKRKIKKRTLALALTLALLAGLPPTAALAAEGDPSAQAGAGPGGISLRIINDRYRVDGLVYKETGPGEVQLIGCESGFAGALTVPAEIAAEGRRFAVTGIGAGAFEGSHAVTGLDLSRSDNLVKIGENAFSGCAMLTGTVAIPASVREIGPLSFEQSGITGLDLSGADGLERIGDGAFFQCASLAGTVTIPAGVVEIGSNAFPNSAISSLDLTGADKLKRIGEGAFSECASLGGIVTIPAGVEEIESNTFLKSAISGLNLSGATGLERIGSQAFYECTSLTSTLTIPAGVVEIGREAFYGSAISGLDLTGATNLTDIGISAFKGCASLSGTVVIPSGLRRIGNEAFIRSGMTGLDLAGANSLTDIGDYAFLQCHSLTGTVSVPASVRQIGVNAFKSTQITSFIAADNPTAVLIKDSGVAAEKITLSGGGVPVLPNIPTTFTMDGLTYAVTGHDTVTLTKGSGLSGVFTVPATVRDSNGTRYRLTEIGTDAIRLAGITALDLSGAVNLTRIGESAFGECGNLTAGISIPASVTEIGDGAFQESGITGLDLSGAAGLTRIGEAAFSSCSSLTGSLSIPASVTEIGNQAFYQSAVTGLNLSGADSLTRIGKAAFSRSALTGTLTIPPTVTEIGESAFYHNPITGLDLSGADSLTRIGKSAFSRNALTGTLIIPPTVTEIGESAFYYNDLITGLDLSGANSLTRIGEAAFDWCKLTGTLTIPPTVTEIGKRAFAATNLTQVDVRGRLRAVGQAAFPETAAIHCADPATQLLVNEALHQQSRPTASWDGAGDVPGGALVTVDGAVDVTGSVTVESGAEATVAGPNGALTVPDGASVTLKSGAVLTVGSGGTLAISPGAALGGGGKIIVEPGGTLTGTPDPGITVEYRTKPSGGGSGGSFGYAGRTLTDRETGVKVTGGSIHPSAELTVRAGALHGAGDAGCDLLRAAREAGHLLGVWDVSLSRDFRSSVAVSLPLAGRDGETLTVAHCTGGKLALADVKVSGGFAGVETDSLSPFAVLDGVYTLSGLEELARPKNPFADISETDWFYGAALYVYGRGVMSGTGGDSFSPNRTTTRAMMAAILYRLEGAPSSPVEGSSFNDVPSGLWYTDAVVWCAAKGLVNGYGDGAFRPNDPVTRQQLAALLHRYARYRQWDVGVEGALSGFADAAAVSVWAEPAVRWACGAGVLNGSADGRLRPEAYATRAEVAAMLMRLLERYAPDPSPTA